MGAQIAWLLAALAALAAAGGAELDHLVMDPSLPASFLERRNRIAQERDEQAPHGRLARAHELAPGLLCEDGVCRGRPAPDHDGPRSSVKVSLAKGRGLTFCVGCNSPHDEGGSWADTWDGHYGVRDFHIHGDLILAVPNTASGELAMQEFLRGQVVLAERGDNSFNDKARLAQQAGAAALVVIDTGGECDAAFRCGPLTGSRDKGGLAHRDYWARWQDIVIPVALVTQRDGDRLKRALNLAAVDVPGVGMQLVNRELT